jgi:hypothetical protein
MGLTLRVTSLSLKDMTCPVFPLYSPNLMPRSDPMWGEILWWELQQYYHPDSYGHAKRYQLFCWDCYPALPMLQFHLISSDPMDILTKSTDEAMLTWKLIITHDNYLCLSVGQNREFPYEWVKII